jgi:hypothetical protein
MTKGPLGNKKRSTEQMKMVFYPPTPSHLELHTHNTQLGTLPIIYSTVLTYVENK